MEGSYVAQMTRGSLGCVEWTAFAGRVGEDFEVPTAALRERLSMSLSPQ